MPKIEIKKSTREGKKLQAILTYDDGKTKTIHFGSEGMDDYTITKDKEQRSRYLLRHRKNENWDVPDTAGSLSRWILWGPTTSRQENIRLFKKRFNLK
jgi:hypothetical protein